MLPASSLFFERLDKMLPRKYRLKNQKAFSATYKNHRIISNDIMTIYVGKEKKEPDRPTKFGFVVSKKYHKRAVKRNRIKRLLRESVRLAIKSNSLGKLDDYMSFIIMPKATDSVQKLTFFDVNKSFLKLIGRLK